MHLPQLREAVDDALRSFLDGALPPMRAVGDELVPLADAAASFVLDGGKRLRPAFCYWGYVAAGGEPGSSIVRAAAALELLQAGALVHDDVIDDSDTRRGSPAVHRAFAKHHADAGWTGDSGRFGTAAAILLGDLALIWADAMLAGSGVAPDALTRALPVWDAMRTEVMYGQYLDVVEQARGGGSVDRALRVARFKTAKYTVERPLHLGAALAADRPDLVESLSAYGLALGVAFQLRDDVLGVFGDPATTGKPAGDDLREGKRTALVAYAAEVADQAQQDALARLGDPAMTDADVDRVRAVLRDTGAVDRVEELIAQRTAEALQALDGAEITADAASALRELAVTVTDRAR